MSEMHGIRRLKDACPICWKPMHYSGDWDNFVCLECSWIEGEEYKLEPRPLSISDYTTVVAFLYKQERSRILEYQDYCDILKTITIK